LHSIEYVSGMIVEDSEGAAEFLIYVSIFLKAAIYEVFFIKFDSTGNFYEYRALASIKASVLR